MKLYGYKKEHYDYVKDGSRKVGDSVTLYFGYKVPEGEGQGAACIGYNCDSRLSKAILEGRKKIVIGGEYDLVPGTYGNIAEIIYKDTGGKESKA